MSVINIKCEILFQADFPSIKYKIFSFKSVQALKTKPVVLIQTDKSDYRPKQDVKFRSLFHKYQNATISPVNLIDKTYLTGIIIDKNCSYIFFYHQVNLHSENLFKYRFAFFPEFFSSTLSWNLMHKLSSRLSGLKTPPMQDSLNGKMLRWNLKNFVDFYLL